MGKSKSHNNNFSRNAQRSTKDKPSRLSLWITEWITDWWGIEILCWIIAVMSLLSIVIALESHKSKPVPEWPIGITINSLVSIFATIAQMAMMKPVVECISQLKWLWFVRKERLSAFQIFDDASRGPTGSLILLGKIRGLHLICLGAVVTVVSISFGPFAQQVVVYPQRLHPTGISTTPQVLLYTGARDVGGDPSSEMIAAIIQGFGRDNQTLSTITPSCSTGNCTWDIYPTLGVCPDIVDISSSLVQSPCNQTVLDKNVEDMTGAKNPGYKCFNWTYPVEAEVYSTRTSQWFQEDVSMSNENSIVSNAGAINGNGGIAVETLSVVAAQANAANNTFMAAYLLYQPGFYTSTNLSLPEPVAYMLTLSFCLQALNTSVTDGVATTFVESTWPLGTTAFQSGFLDISGSNISESQGTVSLEGNNFGVSQEGTGLLIPTVQSIFLDDCFQLLNLSEHVAFGCEGNSGSYFVNPLFTGPNATSPDRYSVVETFRTGAGNDTHVVDFQGTAYAPVPYVDTVYEWLILPIALVFLTLVFLLATILKSQRLGSRVWKSSNFATLQGLAGELHTDLGGLSSISEMEEKAEEKRVRFDGRVDGGVKYRLVEVKQEKSWMG